MTNRGNLDELWERTTHQASWLDGVSPEQHEWLTSIAKRAVELETEPIWTKVRKAFISQWPDSPPVASTLATAVRKLMGEIDGED